MTACLDCGRPGGKGSRCSSCQSKKDREHAAPYRGDYPKRAKATRQQAAGGRCPNCGEPYTADNPPTGGHAVPVREGGSLEEGLVPHCRRCNSGWRRTGL